MTAPTQTTSPGWHYADGDPSADRQGWDGRLWPEITGYRGYNITVAETVVVEDIQVIEAPIDVVGEAEPQLVVETEPLIESAAKVRVKPPRLFEVVELKNAATNTPAEIPELPERSVSRPSVSDIVEPTADLTQAKKSSVGLYLAVALILIVIALILGVAL